MLVTGLVDGRVIVWSVPRRRWVATFLPVSRYQWIAYTREGYFIGSNNVEDSVNMYFGRKGRSYSASALAPPRDNPNPDEVAAALTLGQEDARGEITMRRERTAVAGQLPKLLDVPEP